MKKDKKWWAFYWKRKGHIRKKLVSQYTELDALKIFCYKNVHMIIHVAEGNMHFLEIKIINDKMIVTPMKKPNTVLQEIPIDKTPCHFGNYRYWFKCPNPSCNRRVRKLYLVGRRMFFCRKCLNLSYQVQLLEPIDRHLYMQSKIEKLLGQKDSASSMQKPPHMHQQTFRRLQDRYWKHQEQMEDYAEKLFSK